MSVGISAATLVARLAPAPDLARVVDAIGRPEFGWCLLSYLHALCGADHCAMYRLGRDSVAALSGDSIDMGLTQRRMARYLTQEFWRRDPAMSPVLDGARRNGPLVVRMQLDRLEDSDLRQAIYPDMSDRLVVAGSVEDAGFSMSILRAAGHPGFTDDDVGRVSAAAQLLLSLLAKHADWLRGDPGEALATVLDIEQCLRAISEMPRREAQVCARVLRGISTAGIALDLAIGVESVKTYRKRAYQRLGIGSEHELLAWYLPRWVTWRRASQRIARH